MGTFLVRRVNDVRMRLTLSGTKSISILVGHSVRSTVTFAKAVSESLGYTVGNKDGLGHSHRLVRNFQAVGLPDLDTTSLKLSVASQKKAVPKSIGGDLPHRGIVRQIYSTGIKIRLQISF